MNQQKIIALSLLSCSALAAAAQPDEAAESGALETVRVSGKRQTAESLPFGSSRKAGDVVIDGKKF